MHKQYLTKKELNIKLGAKGMRLYMKIGNEYIPVQKARLRLSIRDIDDNIRTKFYIMDDCLVSDFDIERDEKKDECKHCNEKEGLEICCACGNKICDDHLCHHLNQIYCSMYCLNMGRIEGMMR